jgi:hypothetical protein
MASIRFYRTDSKGEPQLLVKAQTGTDQAVKNRLFLAFSRVRGTGVPFSLERHENSWTMRFPGFQYMAAFDELDLDASRFDWHAAIQAEIDAEERSYNAAYAQYERDLDAAVYTGFLLEAV